MEGMFYMCTKLEYLDISYFEIISTKTMQSMFAETSSLEYIKMPSFQIKFNITFIWTFGNHNANQKICLPVVENQRFLNLKENIFDCSEKCFNKAFKFDLKDNICKEFCNQSEYNYEYNNVCNEKCPNHTFVQDDNEFFC